MCMLEALESRELFSVAVPSLALSLHPAPAAVYTVTAGSTKTISHGCFPNPDDNGPYNPKALGSSVFSETAIIG